MTTTSVSPSAALEKLLRDNDLGWMIDWYAPRERALPVLLARLEQTEQDFQSRFGFRVSFSPDALAAEADRNPHKIKAFLQSLRFGGNRDMPLMAWRILQGLTIHEVDLTYRAQDSFRLRVTLTDEGACEQYDSDDIHDAALLRHFGIATVDGRPLFDGFFPLRMN